MLSFLRDWYLMILDVQLFFYTLFGWLCSVLISCWMNLSSTQCAHTLVDGLYWRHSRLIKVMWLDWIDTSFIVIDFSIFNSFPLLWLVLFDNLAFFLGAVHPILFTRLINWLFLLLFLAFRLLNYSRSNHKFIHDCVTSSPVASWTFVWIVLVTLTMQMMMFLPVQTLDCVIREQQLVIVDRHWTTVFCPGWSLWA